MESKLSNIILQGQGSETNKIGSRLLQKQLLERNSRFKFYAWDIIQNYAYITYLVNYREIFKTLELRKRYRVFHRCSKLVKTRDHFQIKSHHQKMLNRHSSIEGIVSFMREKIIQQLLQKPQLVPEIVRINKEAQQFFMSERNKAALDQIQNQQRRSIRSFRQTIKLLREMGKQTNSKKQPISPQMAEENQQMRPQTPQLPFINLVQEQQVLIKGEQ